MNYPILLKFSINSWEFLDEPSDKVDDVLKKIIAEWVREYEGYSATPI